MRWVAHALAAVLLAAGCKVPSVGDCAVQCTAAGGCPDGLTCETEGYCRVAGADLSCAALLDGGGEDDDGGGAGDPDAAPCTTPGGCPLFFGRPSPVLEVHRSTGPHGSPHLTSDRLRLYFVTGDQLLVAARQTPGDPFDATDPVAGDDLASYLVGSASLSDDELVLAVSARTAEDDPGDLYVASREGTGDAFGPLELVPPSEGGKIELDVALSPDGLELWFSTDRDGPFRIYRLDRPTRDEAFDNRTEVILPGDGIDDTAPTPSPDGYSLMFSRQTAPGERRLMRAFRADLGSLEFEAPEELDELTLSDVPLSSPFLAEDGRELFYTSTQPWSPSTTAIWRVHVCSTGTCNDAEVACDEGTLSADGRHCYFLSGDTSNWNSGVSTCTNQGGHLVTIHSAAENDVVHQLLSEAAMDPAWIGATDEDAECNVSVEPCWFAWVTDEPRLYESWAGAQPDDTAAHGENCAWMATASGLWHDAGCEDDVAAVCETELPYPWW